MIDSIAVGKDVAAGTGGRQGKHPGFAGRRNRIRDCLRGRSSFDGDENAAPGLRVAHETRPLRSFRVSENKKRPVRNYLTGLFNLIPAMTYAPTQLPVQYHRPGEA